MIRWLAARTGLLVIGDVIWSLLTGVPPWQIEQGPRFWTLSPIQKLNEYMYELYKPSGQPAIEILFFHGLQFGQSGDAYLSTWTTGDGSRDVWPGTWLAQEFPKARIISVSYDFRMTRQQGRSDLFRVAENLMDAICCENIGQGIRRPVVLIGHGFGGLVMKQLCVKADQEHSLDPNSEQNQKVGKFLRNVGGLFFYGTPHRGIYPPPGAAHLHESPLLDYAKLLSVEGARLETIFNAVCKKYKIWHIASVGESQETSWGLSHLLIVPEGSARYNTDFCTIPADHISVCKPAKRTSNNFQRLINFIPKVQGEARFENNQFLPKKAVGLDVGVEVVSKMLQHNARVGIYGMGGVGKTTLAMAVFNYLGPTFEYSCFCPDVKLTKGTVQDVKKRIWEHMYCDGKKVREKTDGWSKLREKQLLLVLDDVARDIDVEVVSQVASVVAAESRFILLSSDKEILMGLDDIELYQVPFLSVKDAKPLFLSYAFPNQAEPPPALENHIDDVVKLCEGLPLMLAVMGKYLERERNGDVWEQTIQVLQKAESGSKLTDRLCEKLRPSYDLLGQKQQQMFLDAAIFFCSSRWTLYEAKAAWSVIYGDEVLLLWQSLVDACLVYDVEEDGQIKVHELLQSLGRLIVAEDTGPGGEFRRLWNREERSFSLRFPEHGWEDLEELRYKDVDDEAFGWQSKDEMAARRPTTSKVERPSRTLSGDIDGAQENKSLRTDEVLLRFSPRQVPFDPDLHRRLAVLELTHYGEQSMPSSFGQLKVLKILRISNATLLETLPDEIGGLTKLERLEFHQFDQLKMVPETFGCLSNLNYLVFDECTKLHTLPESLGSLSALRHLDLKFCESLDTLPDSFGALSALSYLEILSCNNLHALPESFGALSALSHLQILSCYYLHALPESFGALSALNHLQILSCYNLHALPESFGALSALSHLQILSCYNLHALPESFGALSALNHLEILSCNNLHTLPESFGGLSALNHLEILSCCNLHALPESFGALCALNHLEILSCNNLHTLPESFGGLSDLNHLEILSCCNLHALPESFGTLSALNHLEILSCNNLHTLPESFGALSALNHLQILSCYKLHTLPESFGALSALNHLEFHDCHNLRTLPPSFGYLSTLKHLEFHYCYDLHNLPNSLGGLTTLKHLELHDFRELQTMPKSFGRLSALNHLEFLKCDNLRTLPESFGRLSSLKHLLFNCCESLHTLPDSFGQLSALNHLEFRTCGSLHSLPESFGQLSSLTQLEFCDCSALHTLPDSFGQLALLSSLVIVNCRKLERLSDPFSQLKSLQHLTIKYIAMKSIPDSIRDLPSLQILELGFLPYLKRLPLWLGETVLAPPNMSQKFFRAQDGHFTSVEPKEDEEWEVSSEHVKDWLHANAMDKVTALDYAGALAGLAAFRLEVLDPRCGSFILQERGIIKRHMGDLQGALEDLTLALEKDDERVYYYGCRKHRGFVRYLMGDIEGARQDGKAALMCLPRLPQSRTSPSLGDQSVSYLDFRLLGVEEMQKLLQLKARMKSAIKKVILLNRVYHNPGHHMPRRSISIVFESQVVGSQRNAETSAAEGQNEVSH